VKGAVQIWLFVYYLFIYIVSDCVMVNVKGCGRSDICRIEAYPSMHVGELMNVIRTQDGLCPGQELNQVPS
jgi:hypothetical protein